MCLRGLSQESCILEIVFAFSSGYKEVGGHSFILSGNEIHSLRLALVKSLSPADMNLPLFVNCLIFPGKQSSNHSQNRGKV